MTFSLSRTISTVILAIVMSPMLATAKGHTAAIWSTHTPESTRTNGQTDLSIMTYNVDNLFDTVHADGKDDIAYLPYSEKQTPEHKAACNKISVFPWRQECLYLDWSPAVYERKLARVADVIKTINNGLGPDILVLEEIENLGVLNKLNNEYLAASGYKTAILIDGKDDRGINQAVLSRLPLNEPAYNFPIPLVERSGASRKDPSHTRGLLRVILTLPDGQPLTVYAVHLPSGGDAHDLRVQALDFIKQTRATYTPKRAMAVVAGDFNINAKEDQQYSMWDDQMTDWSVTHRLGCDDCIGTEYYATAKQWSFLDAILFTHNMTTASAHVTKSWKLDPDSIQTPTYHSEQLRPDGKPNVFNAKTGSGVSDHLPVFAIIHKQKQLVR